MATRNDAPADARDVPQLPARGRRVRAVRRDRSAELLEVAARVFAEHGYEAATIQQIADALGIQKGSLYHYVRRKEDLLYLIVARLQAEQDELYGEVFGRTDLDPLERLELCVRRHVVYTVRNRFALRTYYRDADRLSPAHRAQLTAGAPSTRRLFVRLIREAHAAGHGDEASDPELEYRLYIGAISSLTEWYEPGSAQSLERLTAATVTFVLNGLAGARRPAAG